MPTQLCRTAYQQLIEEDIEWLLKQPRTLERDHIEAVLKDSPERIYGKQQVKEFNLDLTNNISNKFDY